MFSPCSSIPLVVEAVFDTDGNVTPLAVIAEGGRYEIDHIYGVHSHTPVGIPGLAKEYECKIGCHRRSLYYVKDGNTWWSLR